MRILLLNDRIPPENRGGAGAVVWRLAQELKRQSHDVHVIAATDKDSFEEIRDDIPTYHIHVSYSERLRAYFSLYNLQVNSALKELYKRIQPDAINAHNIHQYLTYNTLSIAHKMNIPAIFSSHDVMPFAYHKMSHFIKPDVCGVTSPDDYRLPPFYNFKQMRWRYNPFRNLTIKRILTTHARIRTAPSQELCHAHHANDLPDFICVHNGIDVNQFTASQETIDALRTRLKLEGRKVILFAGRLTGAKGTKPLLDTLQFVAKDVPEACLLVLSSVSIDEQIQDEQYANLKENHIVSGGWLSGEDLAGAFHLSDVLVVPSLIFDTFPTVNLEAMASKSVVLATCSGGSREAVLDGETGYIINPYDTDDFARKLSTLLSDDTLRESMAEKAYQRVRSRFTIEHQAKTMLALYQKAIANE